MSKCYVKLFFLLIILNVSVINNVSANNDNIIKMNAYIEMGKYKLAYDKALSIDLKKYNKDKRAVLYNKIGFIYFKLNKFNLALKSYSKSIDLDKDLYYVYNNIGVIYFKKNYYKKAKKYYLKALKANKNYPKVLVNLAVVDFYMKNFIGSLSWYKKALFQDKDYINKRFDNKKAMITLKELIEKNPDDEEFKSIYKWVLKNRDKDIMDFNL